MFLQHLDDGEGDLCRVDAFLLDLDVLPCLQDGNGRSIGTWTSDPKGFEFLDKAGFVISRRRLGKVLFRFDVVKGDRLPFLEFGQQFVFFVVPCHFVEAVEEQFPAAGLESTFLPFEKDGL